MPYLKSVLILHGLIFCHKPQWIHLVYIYLAQSVSFLLAHLPWLSLRVRSGLCSISFMITLPWPWNDAECSGVHSVPLFGKLMSALKNRYSFLPFSTEFVKKTRPSPTMKLIFLSVTGVWDESTKLSTVVSCQQQTDCLNYSDLLAGLTLYWRQNLTITVDSAPSVNIPNKKKSFTTD